MKNSRQSELENIQPSFYFRAQELIDLCNQSGLILCGSNQGEFSMIAITPKYLRFSSGHLSDYTAHYIPNNSRLSLRKREVDTQCLEVQIWVEPDSNDSIDSYPITREMTITDQGDIYSLCSSKSIEDIVQILSPKQPEAASN